MTMCCANYEQFLPIKPAPSGDATTRTPLATHPILQHSSHSCTPPRGSRHLHSAWRALPFLRVDRPLANHWRSTPCLRSTTKLSPSSLKHHARVRHPRIYQGILRSRSRKGEETTDAIASVTTQPASTHQPTTTRTPFCGNMDTTFHVFPHFDTKLNSRKVSTPNNKEWMNGANGVTFVPPHINNDNIVHKRNI